MYPQNYVYLLSSAEKKEAETLQLNNSLASFWNFEWHHGFSDVLFL
jgi:hypothetical protein